MRAAALLLGALLAGTSIILAGTSIILAGPAFADDAAPGRISVVGRASREVVPDFATVEVAVESRGPTPAAALDQNSAAARKVLDLAGEFGIVGADLATAAVSLRPPARRCAIPAVRCGTSPTAFRRPIPSPSGCAISSASAP